MATIHECDKCGLCCKHLLVETDALDVLREPKINQVAPIQSRRKLSVLNGCWIIAGPGKPCSFLAKDNNCSIYNSRPLTCVSFQAGSPKCKELRKVHGLKPLQSVRKPGVMAEIQEQYITDYCQEDDEDALLEHED